MITFDLPCGAANRCSRSSFRFRLTHPCALQALKLRARANLLTVTDRPTTAVGIRLVPHCFRLRNAREYAVFV
jgi:hypothetical protein